MYSPTLPLRPGPSLEVQIPWSSSQVLISDPVLISRLVMMTVIEVELGRLSLPATFSSDASLFRGLLEQPSAFL